MSTEPNNQPVRETAVVDGADPTDQEKALMEQGLDNLPEEEGGQPAAAAAAAAAAPAAGTTDEAAAAAAAADAAGEAGKPDAAAEKAEAERLAAEQAEQQRLEQIERENAEARANADTIAKAAGTEQPAPPVDFDKAYEELEQLREDGDLEAEDYAKKLRDLTRQETAHTLAVQEWKHEQRRLADEAQAARTRAENAWNAAALQWEADNQEFMSNLIRQKYMQDAINLVIEQNAKQGTVMAPTAVLAEAAKHAFDMAKWEAPTPAPQKDPKQEINAALASRKPAATSTTLGDVPTAGNDVIKGNQAYELLDRASIEDVEEAASRMTPAEQEKWLRDAPGANANGRGNDE